MFHGEVPQSASKPAGDLELLQLIHDGELIGKINELPSVDTSVLLLQEEEKKRKNQSGGTSLDVGLILQGSTDLTVKRCCRAHLGVNLSDDFHQVFVCGSMHDSQEALKTEEGDINTNSSLNDRANEAILLFKL